MTDLPQEAKDAIADAVRIVREDRQEKFQREMRDHFKTGQPPTTEPPVDPNKPVPPPLKPPVTEPPVKKKGGIWWPASDDEPESEPPSD